MVVGVAVGKAAGGTHRILEPHPAALRQPDATTAATVDEFQLNTTVPCLGGKASSHASRPGDQASASSGLPPNIQHMMSKARSRER